MPCCAIKVCRNYKGRLRANHKPSFHRIPTDPVMRSRWIDVIRKSRKEDLWQPSKFTVMCSDHFHEKDKYFACKETVRRLRKNAIPCKALFLSSVKSDESEISDDDNKGLPTKKSLVEETAFISITEDDQPSTPKKSHVQFEEKRAISFKNDQPSTSKTCDDVGDFLDLETLLDTPRKIKLREELVRKERLQKKHSLKIQSLKRKNLRLKKKIASLIQIIGTLKKERYIDNDTHNIIKNI